jgi:HEPN domain-containing protein
MTPRVSAWLRQARSDFAVAQLTEAGKFHSLACYHYGQAAEKAVSGLLLALGTMPPYSHSLDRLVDALAGLGVDVSPLQVLHLKALSRMNSDTRYPREDKAPADRFDERDSAQAHEAAEQVLGFVEAALAG